MVIIAVITGDESSFISNIYDVLGKARYISFVIIAIIYGWMT